MEGSDLSLADSGASLFPVPNSVSICLRPTYPMPGRRAELLGPPLPPTPCTAEETDAQAEGTDPRSFSKLAADPGLKRLSSLPGQAHLSPSCPCTSLGVLQLEEESIACRRRPSGEGGSPDWPRMGREGAGGSCSGEGWNWNLAYWQWGRGRGRCLSVRGRKHPSQPATPQQRVAAPWPPGGGEDVGGGMLGAVFPFWPGGGGGGI